MTSPEESPQLYPLYGRIFYAYPPGEIVYIGRAANVVVTKDGVTAAGPGEGIALPTKDELILAGDALTRLLELRPDLSPPPETETPPEAP